MSSFFASPTDPWFRIGWLEVGSTLLVVFASIATWVVWAVAPILPQHLALTTDSLAAVQVWRLVTWPLASAPGPWELITLFLFYYFGVGLEQTIGTKKMARLLIGIWASLTAVFLLVSIFTWGALAGLRTIEIVVILVWIAEYPKRPFLFNIPAWVFGIVLVGLEVLNYLAVRSASGLISFLLGLFLVAVIARRLGMLTDIRWIPGRPTRPRPAPMPKHPRERAPRPAAPRAKTPRAQVRQARQQASIQERIDELLDKISEHGIDSLTPAERRELMKLRESRKQR